MDYNKDIILSSNLSIRRNIKGYDFPTSMTFDESMIIIDKFKEIFSDRLVLLSDLDDNTIDRLIYKMILSQDCRDKLAQIAVVFQGDTTIVINDRDHLSINISDFFTQVKVAFKKARQIEKDLDDHIDFAFSPRLGYLTSNARNTGSAVQISYKTFLFGLLSETTTYYGFKQAMMYEGMYVDKFIPKGLKSYADDLYILSNYGNYRDDLYAYLDRVEKNIETIVKNESKFRRDYRILNKLDDKEVEEEIKIIENNLLSGLVTSLDKMMRDLYILKKYLLLGFDSKIKSDDIQYLILNLDKRKYRGNFDLKRSEFLQEYLGEKYGEQ